MIDRKRNITILFTGGGSGGHLYPLLAVVDELTRICREDYIALEAYYMGPQDKFRPLIESRGMKTIWISGGKWRRYFSIENFFDIPKMFIGLIQAMIKMFFIMPDAIFSKGGTGALPVIVAGWFYRIPIIIHESDATPGVTNLLSARFASRIAVGFQAALPYFHPQKTAWIGNPIGQDLIGLQPSQEEAKESLGFDKTKPLLAIIGGSQGAQKINEFMLQNLKALLEKTQIYHQTGRDNFEEVQKLSRAVIIETPLQGQTGNRYVAVSYIEKDMKTVLVAADLVVCRAGSNTISELAAFHKPAVLIPLGSAANDHQRANAYEFSKTGAAVVIEENNLLPGIFLSQINSILGDPTALLRMSEASKNFYKPGAAEIIAREIIAVA